MKEKLKRISIISELETTFGTRNRYDVNKASSIEQASSHEKLHRSELSKTQANRDITQPGSSQTKSK